METKKSVNIWKNLQKVPAGTMFVPLIIGAIITTVCEGFFQFDLWDTLGNPMKDMFSSSGQMLIIGLMLFCTGTQLKKALEPYVEGNRNVFYVLKATGLFKTMHVRSCFASEKPYPTLSEVAENQREFHFENTKGDVIAVWCPQYVNGINLPGWHFHYLSHDKTQGGHILGLSADDLSAKTAAVEGVKK